LEFLPLFALLALLAVKHPSAVRRHHFRRALAGASGKLGSISTGTLLNLSSARCIGGRMTA
jgi:hypothetical protein